MVVRIPMTVNGHASMQKRLHHLKRIERPKIVKEIEIAREHGDLSENAEYHAAKEKQSHIEGKIQELEDKLSRSEVIDPSKLNEEHVVFGATVTLIDSDTEEESVYMIVGEDEADIKSGLISITAPLARALIGHHVDDEVTVKTPRGLRSYEILKLEYK